MKRVHKCSGKGGKKFDGEDDIVNSGSFGVHTIHRGGRVLGVGVKVDGKGGAVDEFSKCGYTPWCSYWWVE